MLCVKSAIRLRRPASLTEGLVSAFAGMIGVGDGELFASFFPFRCLAADASTPVDVAVPLAVVGVGFSCSWECPCPPVAIRNALSIAMNVTSPTNMPTPSKRFLFGSKSTNRTLSGSSSPKNISGNRWNNVSPNSPPTANATITLSDEGSMFGGHNASRKFGGPEMYAVARRALMAGEEEGKM